MKKANMLFAAIGALTVGPLGLNGFGAEGASAKTYMIVDLESNSTCRVSYRATVPEGGWSDEFKTTKLVLRLIPEGKFKMSGRPKILDVEHPYFQEPIDPYYNEPFFSREVREVALTHPYYIGVFEVTQRQYELVTGKNPACWVDGKHPVNCVSWLDVRGKNSTAPDPSGGTSRVDRESFLGRLRKMSGVDGFDLPTEAQWECACKGGVTEDIAETRLGPGPSVLHVARCMENGSEEWPSNHIVAVVGSYAPNPYGLFDMHGNVFEWCLDRRARYDEIDRIDPINFGEGASPKVKRVLRGGSCRSEGHCCGSSFRWAATAGAQINEYGFRVVCRVPEDEGSELNAANLR